MIVLFEYDVVGFDVVGQFFDWFILFFDCCLSVYQIVFRIVVVGVLLFGLLIEYGGLVVFFWQKEEGVCFGWYGFVCYFDVFREGDCGCFVGIGVLDVFVGYEFVEDFLVFDVGLFVVDGDFGVVDLIFGKFVFICLFCVVVVYLCV